MILKQTIKSKPWRTNLDRNKLIFIKYLPSPLVASKTLEFVKMSLVFVMEQKLHVCCKNCSAIDEIRLVEREGERETINLHEP